MSDKKYIYYGILFLLIQAVAIIRNLSDSYNYFFWFCDFVPLLFAIGFFFKNTNFVKGLINIGFIPQIAFLFDFLYHLILGKSLFPLTEEIFALGFFVIISTLCIHLSTSLAFLFTYKEKPNKNVLYYSCFSLILIYAVTLIFTSPLEQINFVYGPGAWFSYFVSYTPYYTVLWLVLAFVIFVIPTQFVQYLAYKIHKRFS